MTTNQNPPHATVADDILDRLIHNAHQIDAITVVMVLASVGPLAAQDTVPQVKWRTHLADAVRPPTITRDGRVCAYGTSCLVF